MAVETPVEVVAVGAGTVTLKALGSCSGCTSCAGSCGLGWQAGREVSLPRQDFGDFAAVGRRLWLRSEAAGLRDRALVGYGLPLAGLVVGALAGHGLAELLALSLNAVAAVGAIAGTLSGLLVSNRIVQSIPWVSALQVRAADRDTRCQESFPDNS